MLAMRMGLLADCSRSQDVECHYPTITKDTDIATCHRSVDSAGQLNFVQGMGGTGSTTWCYPAGRME